MAKLLCRNKFRNITMQFTQELFIGKEIHDNIKTILKSSDAVFEQSHVYNAIREEKQLVPEIRLSCFRTLTDKRLFDIGSSILRAINKDMPENRFMIHENDITHIKYHTGGYFKQHEDYLSLNSNIVEEYTMIICVDADCVGGETVLSFNKYFKHHSKMTNTPTGCLLFRKDIPHEGAVLLAGTKEIITFNVWSVKNDVESIVIVNFANDERKYYLSTNDIMRHDSDNILKILINTSKEHGIFTDSVLQYTDPHSYDAFAVIEKIITGTVVSYQEYEKYLDVIKYYLFDTKNVIIKAIEDNVLHDRKNDVFISDDYLFFGNQKKYVDFVANIKKFKLPYVPFKIIFVEGSIFSDNHGEGGSVINVKMMPAWVSFSENDNIVRLRNFMSRGDDEAEWYSDESVIRNVDRIKEKIIQLVHWEYTGSTSVSVDESELSEYDSSDEDVQSNMVASREDYEWENIPIYINLLGYRPDLNNSDVIKFLAKRSYYRFHVNKYNDFESHYQSRVDRDYENYSIVNNKLVLRKQHIPRILNKIKDIRLYESIISNLNNVAISSTQRSVYNEERNYCNENVYGTFNIVTIYGGLIC